MVVLCVNLFLSGHSDPYRFADTNTFNDLSLYLLIVLYVGHMMNETNFFLLLGMLSMLFLLVSFGLVMLVKSRAVSGWQRVRAVALPTSISPSFLGRRERRGMKNVVVPHADDTHPPPREHETGVAGDALSRLRQIESSDAALVQPELTSASPPPHATPESSSERAMNSSAA